MRMLTSLMMLFVAVGMAIAYQPSVPPPPSMPSIAHNAIAGEEDCFIDMGDQINLCAVRHLGNGLILEFEMPVASFYVDLVGPDAKIEYWTRRSDIGDLSAAVVRKPDSAPRPCEIWGGGYGSIPPIVAVRLTGDIVVLEDMVYAD